MNGLRCLAVSVLCLCTVSGMAAGIKKVDDRPTSPVLHSDCQIFPQCWDEKSSETRYTVIDLRSQHLACYEKGRLVRICDVSTAKTGYDDLVGEWSVLRKSKDAVSSVWKDDDGNPFPMPWAVAIGGGYWIHQGKLPGYPASHGCIRMRAVNAEWYFNWSRRGDKGCSCENFANRSSRQLARR